MSEQFSIRLATRDDIPTLLLHRRAMFVDIGHTDPAALDAMGDRFRPWLEQKMAEGIYFTWLAVDNTTQAVAAGAGLWLQDWPAAPHNLSGCRAYVLNVYTDPAYRQRGLARRLMQTILDWCQAREIPMITLHASPYGRHLYETLGFETTNYLMKKF